MKGKIATLVVTLLIATTVFSVTGKQISLTEECLEIQNENNIDFESKEIIIEGYENYNIKPLVGNVFASTWTKNYNTVYGWDEGGYDEKACCIIETHDGGYMVLGNIDRFDNSDFFLMKLDANGETTKLTFYDSLGKPDFATSMVEVYIQGNGENPESYWAYVVTGYTRNHLENGYSDGFICQIDENFIVKRSYLFFNADRPTSHNEFFYSIEDFSKLNSANNFVVVGSEQSAPILGENSIVMTLSEKLIITNKKSYGFNMLERFSSVECINVNPTTINFAIVGDNGFINPLLTSKRDGHLVILNEDLTFNTGYKYGEIGEQYYEYIESIKQTSDGGFILVGNQLNRFSGDADSENNLLAIKTDSNGVPDWAYVYQFPRKSGKTCNTIGYDVCESPFGDGFIITGVSYLLEGLYPDENDLLYLKINNNGNVDWARTMGTGCHSPCIWIPLTGDDQGKSVLWNDDGIIIAGFSNSPEIVTRPYDTIVAKYNRDGEKSGSCCYYDLGVPGKTEIDSEPVDELDETEFNLQYQNWDLNKEDITVNFNEFCKGIEWVPISIENIDGGWGISAILKNNGEQSTDVDWSINVAGNLLFLGSETSGTKTIFPNEEIKIKSSLLMGFGPADITVNAKGVTKKASCFLLGPFVTGVEPLLVNKGNNVIYHEDYGDSLWRMNAMGGSQTQLTDFGWFAKYSPNFQKIAFSDFYDNGIWICDANGANPVKITDKGTAPSWSPSGSHLCYHTGGTEGVKRRIWIVASNGSYPHEISDNPGSFPEWSPDGKKIAYHGEVGTGIWVIDPSGANNNLLYNGGGYPSWSPNGKWICYQKFSDRLIWKMTSSGTNHQQLSEFPGIHPDWCPTNDYIAYETQQGSTWIGIRAVKDDSTDDHEIHNRGHAPDWGKV
jgi:hypothetical protein